MSKYIHDAGVKLSQFVFVQDFSPVGNPLQDVAEVVMAKELFDLLHHAAQYREVVSI